MIGSTWLIVSRLGDLRSAKRIDSLASREAVFLVDNLLLVALCAVIFWGTFFPLIAELFTGEKASLAAPWFDRYTTRSRSYWCCSPASARCLPGAASPGSRRGASSSGRRSPPRW